MLLNELLQEVTYANKNLDGEYLNVLTPQINAMSAAFPRNRTIAKIVNLADEARRYISQIHDYAVNWDSNYQLDGMMTRNRP